MTTRRYEIKRHLIDGLYHVYMNGREIVEGVRRDIADAHEFVYIAIVAEQLIKDTSK